MDRGVSGAIKDIPDDLLEDSRLKMGRHHCGNRGIGKEALKDQPPLLVDFRDLACSAGTHPVPSECAVEGF
jgi:hypothetical protein